MKCSYCGKEAVYELETSSGIINVCEECDEDFTICNVCGLIVDVEEARFLNDADERKTCYECIPTGNKVYDIITVELPKNGLTDAQVDDIKRLTKALGRTLTVKDTGEHIQFIYPYSEETGVGIIYSQLSAAFVKHVKTNTVMTTILTRLTKNNNER